MSGFRKQKKTVTTPPKGTQTVRSVTDDAGSLNHANTPNGVTLRCDPCLGDGENAAADGFCLNCNDYLCSACYTAHRKSKTSRSHALKGRPDMPLTKPNVINEMEECPEHRHELVMYYCHTDEKLFCKICRHIDHRYCMKVEAIADICHDLTNPEDMEQIRDELESIKTELDEHRKSAKENKADIEHFFEQAISRLLLIRNEDVDKLIAIDQTCKTDIPRLTDIQTKLVTYKADDRLSFLLKVKAIHQMKVLKERLTSMNAVNAISRYNFKLSDNYTDISSGDLCTISKYRYTSNDILLNMDRSTIRSIELLSDNMIVIADSQNTRLVLIDTVKKTVLSQLNLSVKPHDISKIDEATIAVTVWDRNYILLVSVSDEMTIMKTLDNPDVRWSQGIVSKDHTLIVSLCSRDKPLQVLDLEGNEKRIIYKTDEDDNVKLIDIHYITYNPKTDTLYLSDKSDKVIRMTLDGKVLSCFTHERLQQPNGITMGRDGRVFVCCHRSSNIFELSADLSEGRVLLDSRDGIASPCCVMYHDEDRKLFVGSWYKGTIQVYLL